MGIIAEILREINLVIFDHVRRQNTHASTEREEFVVCDETRHYRVDRIPQRQEQTGANVLLVSNTDFCDGSCNTHGARPVETMSEKNRLAKILIVRVPEEKIAVQIGGDGRCHGVHNAGAWVPLSILGSATILDPGQHIGTMEKDPQGKQRLSLILNPPGKDAGHVVMHNGIDQKDRRQMVQRQIRLMEQGHTAQQARKAVPLPPLTS